MFLKIGKRIVNLDRVTSLYLDEDGVSVGFGGLLRGHLGIDPDGYIRPDFAGGEAEAVRRFFAGSFDPTARADLNNLTTVRLVETPEGPKWEAWGR
jgi:hypothetical protein